MSHLYWGSTNHSTSGCHCERKRSKPVPFSLLLIILLAAPIAAHAQADSGAAWLKAIDTAERVPFTYSEITQTITTSSGSERELKMRSWTAENGDIGLMAYTGPARVRGDRILIRDGGDNIWYYMHRRDVTRHFTGHTRRQSAMGSDFSYEDLSTGDMTEDYTASLRGHESLDTTACVKLRCIPTDKGPSYDSLLIWASVADSLSRKIEYYDGDGLLKTLNLTQFEVVDGRKLSMRYEMVNDREGSHTVMQTDQMDLKDKPAAELFTMQALTRALPKK